MGSRPCDDAYVSRWLVDRTSSGGSELFELNLHLLRHWLAQREVSQQVDTIAEGAHQGWFYLGKDFLSQANNIVLKGSPGCRGVSPEVS